MVKYFDFNQNVTNRKNATQKIYLQSDMIVLKKTKKTHIFFTYDASLDSRFLHVYAQNNNIFINVHRIDFGVTWIRVNILREI